MRQISLLIEDTIIDEIPAEGISDELVQKLDQMLLENGIFDLEAELAIFEDD